MIYSNGESHPALKNPYISTVAYDNNTGVRGSRIALIFDDGYRKNVTLAAPILAEYGFAATLALEAERVGQNYAGEADLPVVTAEDMRTLISQYNWEICNHPNLNTGETEENMVAEARTENENIVALLTGERRWNGSSFVSDTLEYADYSDYKIQGAVYRGGVRTETSDKAYEYLYERTRVINGTIEFSGDRLYGIDPEGRYEQIVSAFPADTDGDATALQRLLSYVRSIAATGGQGLIYAHDTPDSLTGSEVAVLETPPPFIPLAHLRILCEEASKAGVQIVPWYGLGPANMVTDPQMSEEDGRVLAAFSGDTAEYDVETTLNGGARSVALTCSAYRANVASTSMTTHQFSVRPFSRYRVKIRYRIDTELVLNGGTGNINHGLSCLLTTYLANTPGTEGGSIDDWNVNANTSGYSRPYQVTSGWETMEVELYTGYGTAAALTVGLFQCTGTVYIGHISVTKSESIVRSPLSGDLAYNTSLARNVFLMLPPVAPEPVWHWEFRVQDSARLFDAGSDTEVEYAFSDSANIASPQAGEKCYVLGVGAGAFAGHSGEIGTYDGASWSFVTPSANTFIKAANGEGIVNRYYVHDAISSEGVGIFKRLGGVNVYHDRPSVVKMAENWFAVYNSSGARTDTFTWVARPRWVKE